MGMTATLIGLAAGAAAAAVFGWMGARAPDLRRGPRMIPYRMLMVLAAAWCLLMLAHLVNLMGVRTGR